MFRAVDILNQPTVGLALALMAVIVMMILPMPAWIMDLGLTASFAIAILIFTVTLFIERPLDFSAFPTILLTSLMLRLSLNVASTKLIIGNGHTGPSAAGHVIEGFAMFVMGGSIYLGLVSFGVIMIVNFMVITKGAGRMAEVGARFALDAMPGKQLAIDSDMAAGAIDHATARDRRKLEQEETTFFGSLDGASKFVKGDAVAGLMITFLNFIVGLAMGTMVHGMPLKTAFETYSILTVGDGLVTQIPAVIISLASALLLSKGGAVGSADKAVLKQLGNYPQALGTVAFLMALFAVVPGLPFVPFLFASILVGSLALVMSRRKTLAVVTATLIDTTKIRPPMAKIGDLLDIDEIHVQFSKDLVPTVLDESFGLENRILNMRNHIATTFGLIVPEIRLTDSAMLENGTYKIVLQGVDHAKSKIYSDKTLVLLSNNSTTSVPGIDVTEPVYGAPARWIANTLQETAVLEGLTVVSPIEVVATHLLETLKQNFGRIFTRRALRKLLDEIVLLSDSRRGESNRRLIEEFIPEKVSIDVLHSVLKSLLDERVSIRNLQLILEAIAEVQGATRNTDSIAEHVRQRLGFQIVNEYQDTSGALPLIQISQEWEKIFEAFSSEAVNGSTDIALPPDEINRLTLAVTEGIKKGADSGKYPAIVTSARRRKFIQTIIAAKGIRNPVFSYEEIGTRSRPFIVGSI